MSRRPLLLGLTGSIGMGKTTVAGMIRRLGVPVFDADAAVHALGGPGGRLVPAIAALFPDAARAGAIDRARLGAQVLGNPAALRQLEQLIHPAVAADRRDFLRRHRAHRLIVLDVPLLFETRGDRLVDAVALVSAPAGVQRRRVLARPGMTPARLAAIRARQLPDREKRARADFLIPTGTTRLATAAIVRRLIACLRARPVRYCRRCARSCSIPRPPA